jgi:SAM-dependent methyltransferase
MPWRVVSRYIQVKDRDVLEIGGAEACLSAEAFLADGAASVTVTGLDHISAETQGADQRLRIMQADGLSLRSHFEAGSFDIVYGLSVIEHIPSPALFMEEVSRVLRPGGFAFFEGFPLWSSALGHHLWVATWEGASYQGKASTNYLFSELSNTSSINPIPDWGHLLMEEKQLGKVLEEQSLPASDIDCICGWVYHSNEINRLTTSEIAMAYTGSELICLEAITQRVDVSENILKQLWERHGQGCDFGISGLTYVFTKPR